MPSAAPRVTTPPAAVHHFSDFEQLAGFFASWDGRFEQLSAGRFASTLQTARGRVVRVVSAEANQVLLARGRAAQGMFGVYPVGPENAGGLWQGRRLDPGRLVVHGPDAETDHRTARNARVTGVTMPEAAVVRAARLLLHPGVEPCVRTWAAVLPPPAAGAQIRRRVAAILALAADGPGGLATADGHALEQECVRAVVAAVFRPADGRGADLSLPGRSALVRRAEDVMRAKLGEPLGVIDLCEVLNVNDRTLRLAFRERFGVGPMVYWKVLRLNAVRAALRSGASATVARAANEFGFHHLGNFAADYYRQFGERPSAALRWNR